MIKNSLTPISEEDENGLNRESIKFARYFFRIT